MGGGRRRFGISRVQLGTALLSIALAALALIAMVAWSGWWVVPALVVLIVGGVLMVIEGRSDDEQDGDGGGGGGDDDTGGGSGGGDTVISLHQSGGITAHTVNMGPPPPKVQFVREVARNELGGARGPAARHGEDLYCTSAELQIVSDRPAAGLTVAVAGPVESVHLRPVGGGIASTTRGSGPAGAQCTLQPPPPHGRVHVDVLSAAPLEGRIQLQAQAW